MNKTHLWRSIAALTTAIACLAVMASPAPATTHDVTITGGVIRLTKTGVSEDVDLDPSTPSCTNPSTLQVDEDGTTVSVTALNASHVKSFFGGSFLWVLTRSTTGNVAGTLSSTSVPHTITSVRAAVVATIYNTTSCTPTGTPVCTIASIFHMTGTSTSTSATQTFSLTGTSVGTVVAFPTCTAGPSGILGTSSTTPSPITGTITT